ncbi:LacI family transcriptional regulator [Fulvivirga ulvae]|uniref:LacI family DNA-binding transcriptional regulator n=1 Tax=Fulvivirga ulvae TaxID=2904245 RepID=UPI001F2B67C6|nr:LacI family DNA-binding transcriptional regulator [Fulvivirga ulvae]UII30767.1 LacI family transcriptional regulator [Fulvivirga ulvae]
MKNTQITIKDIAKELGISSSTVSRALKDHPNVSPETKKAVTDLAEKYNYQPNSIALSLRRSKSNTIGVIIPEIVHFFFSTVISGIEDIAYSAGYSVIVSQSNESYDREVMDTFALSKNRVDGILISMSRETTRYDHFETIHKRGLPIVFFDRVCDAINCSKVVVDDFDGAYQVTKHLIQQGYKRIAHLAGPESLILSKHRMDGYKKALKEHDMEFDESIILRGRAADNETLARELTTQLLNSDNPPDAMFAINDRAALGVMKAAKEKGLRIPQDFAIAGFSNWEFTAMTDPAITTVDQPGFKMGQEAAKLLIREIEAEEDEIIEPETRILKTDLIIRGSSVISA